MKIVGEKTVRADHAVSYSCLANNANPAPTIEWTVNGKSWTSGVNTFTHPSPTLSNRRLSGEDDSMPGDYFNYKTYNGLFRYSPRRLIGSRLIESVG